MKRLLFMSFALLLVFNCNVYPQTDSIIRFNRIIRQSAELDKAYMLEDGRIATFNYDVVKPSTIYRLLSKDGKTVISTLDYVYNDSNFLSFDEPKLYIDNQGLLVTVFFSQYKNIPGTEVYYVCKINPKTGEMVGKIKIPSLKSDQYISSIAPAPNGGFFCTYVSYNQGLDRFYSWWISLDSLGIRKWVTVIPTTYSGESTYSLIADNNGDFYSIGTTDGKSYGDPVFLNYAASYISKVNGVTGKVIWIKRYGGTPTDSRFYRGQILRNGNFLVYGGKDSLVYLSDTNRYIITGTFIAELDLEGKELWTRWFQTPVRGTGINEVCAAFEREDGTLWALERAIRPMDSGLAPEYIARLLHMDRKGRVLNETRYCYYNHLFHSEPFYMNSTPDGGALFWGRTNQDFSGEPGGVRPWLVKVDSTGCDSANGCFRTFYNYKSQVPSGPPQVEAGGIKLYPNPVRDVLSLYTPENSRFTLATLYDATGKEIAQTTLIPESRLTTIQVGFLASGTYHLICTGKDVPPASLPFIHE